MRVEFGGFTPILIASFFTKPGAQKMTASPQAETLSFQAEVKQILNIVVHSLAIKKFLCAN
jgi:hypothetical protein